MQVFIVSRAIEVWSEECTYYDLEPVRVFVNFDSAKRFAKEKESKLGEYDSTYYVVSEPVEFEG